jgi:hypothetical protein
MLSSHSLILNDMNTTLSVNTKPINGQLSWSLSITNKSGKTTVSTSGYITLDMSSTTSLPPVPKPAIIVNQEPVLMTPLSALTSVAPTNTSEPIAPASEAVFSKLVDGQFKEVKEYVEKQLNASSFPEEEKMKHVIHLRKLIDDCTAAKGKDNKAVVASEILTYITDSALEFTNAYPKFKATVINKCYEFKSEHPEITELIKKADNVLLKLGASTTIPSDYASVAKSSYCGDCTKYHSNTTTKAATSSPANTVVTSVKKSSPPKKPSEEPINKEELALFISIAKLHNNTNAVANPEQWYKWYQNCLKFRTVKGTTPAEKMECYFGVRSDTVARINLMKSLFNQHKLVFSESVMPLYNEWVKTFTYTGKGTVNRYIKMNEFIKTYKSLFTPITN